MLIGNHYCRLHVRGFQDETVPCVVHMSERVVPMQSSLTRPSTFHFKETDQTSGKRRDLLPGSGRGPAEYQTGAQPQQLNLLVKSIHPPPGARART